MKKVFLILTVLLSFVCASLGFAAAPSLDDGAKLLKASERIVLQKELERVEKAHGIRCVVVTRKAIGGAVPGEYANKLKTAIKDKFKKFEEAKAKFLKKITEAVNEINKKINEYLTKVTKAITEKLTSLVTGAIGGLTKGLSF